ncbi:MAG TPA: HEAT repeat domain-containing protein [Proteobacteria bacterium]|nr:HEAT repeat domain-containing protein [Pseudomonadota bacterium]
MKPTKPRAEIVEDLLSSNWELRWQVFEILNRTQVEFRHHAHDSKDQRELSQLGLKLAATINGPNDKNLFVIITALYFLGGNRYIFHIINQLGIDDKEENYPGLQQIKKDLANNSGRVSFFDYFQHLLSSPSAVESTTTIASCLIRRLFPQTDALRLLTTIPQTEIRLTALALFLEELHEFNFNDFLLSDDLKTVQEKPELLCFLNLPLSNREREVLAPLAARLCSQDNIISPFVFKTLVRLTLPCCPQIVLQAKLGNPAALTTMAQLGDMKACDALIATGRSLWRNKRMQAYAGLSFCPNHDALEILRKRINSKNPAERHAVLSALGSSPSPDSLRTLFEALTQTRKATEQRLILQLITYHPQAVPDPVFSDRLANLFDHGDLYPELLEAMSKFGLSPQWRLIFSNFKPPLLLHHEQQTALFMTRFANLPEIRAQLFNLVFDQDWTFSFKLLNLLLPYFSIKDIPLLCELLRKYETLEELSIAERLSLGHKTSLFRDSLCDFFNHNPLSAEKYLSTLTVNIINNSLPATNRLYDYFLQQPRQLRKIFLEKDDADLDRPESELPLLCSIYFLCQIENDGSNCLTTIINHTRKYGGYFTLVISQRLCALLTENTIHSQTKLLPELQNLIDYLRHRPDHDELRGKTLSAIAEIMRHARDLRLCMAVTHERDLRIIKIKKNFNQSEPSSGEP